MAPVTEEAIEPDPARAGRFAEQRVKKEGKSPDQNGKRVEEPDQVEVQQPRLGVLPFPVEIEARAGEFIAELPPPYRDVIWMNDVEGMSAPEIAETLEISIPAFKSRLHRARLAVRQRLSEVAGGRVAAEAAG